MTVIEPRAIGTPVPRIEGPDKVTGTARYAAEQPAGRTAAPLYLRGVPATTARGTVTDVDTAAAEALPGVVAVLTHITAPRMADTSDPELAVLQSDRVHHRGQYVAAVLADTSETARQAAGLVRVTYAEEDATTAFDEHSPDLYTPPRVLFFPPDTVTGDPDAALDAAEVTVRATYRTPAQHHNPMEPHASIACWAEDGNGLTLYESTQSVADSRTTIAGLFGVDADDVAVICPHVGGGFGCKGSRHAASALTVLAARTVPGRAVHCALDRDEMFATTGYRAATVQHVTLAADRDGRLDVLAHDVVEPTARMKEFAEPTAVYSRHLYAARNRRTSHRLLAMDVNVPTYMRAPGEAPGSFGAESAMDELAVALGVDPVELRVRNEPDTDPDTGWAFSTRNLVACLRRGAERFGWAGRDPAPRTRLVDDWWHGTGVAASFFPAMRMPGSTAVIRFDGYRYAVLIGAADIGQGARTVLTQIAADALRVPHDRVDVAIGDTALPHATMAGGSTGTSSWGTAVVDAAERFRDKFGDDPDDGDEADGAATDNPWAAELAMGAYGAHFVEVAVHADTGEIRVPRMLGVFAVGQVLNPTTARSQIVGGMTWGLSMALHEESVLDPRTGHWVNHDLAGYHVPVHADIGELDVEWVSEDDPYVNPMGAKGIGEIGIVGSAAAVANAAFHATGVRVRSLPITLDDFLVPDEFVGAAGERR